MIEFLRAQPEEYREQMMETISSQALQMSILLRLDFRDKPLLLSNRSVAFRDLKWGFDWSGSSGLLVGLPDISAGDGQLAPFREYRLGVPDEWIDRETWAKDLVEAVANVSNYRGRHAGLYGQLFTSQPSRPVGHPFALDVGQMDRMTVSFLRFGAVVKLTSEGFLARKGAPVYGMQTYFDQKRRHPTDEGLEFVTESGKPVVWTNW
jgi:hypothetical protein